MGKRRKMLPQPITFDQEILDYLDIDDDQALELGIILQHAKYMTHSHITADVVAGWQGNAPEKVLHVLGKGINDFFYEELIDGRRDKNSSNESSGNDGTKPFFNSYSGNMITNSSIRRTSSGMRNRQSLNEFFARNYHVSMSEDDGFYRMDVHMNSGWFDEDDLLTGLQWAYATEPTFTTNPDDDYPMLLMNTRKDGVTVFSAAWKCPALNEVGAINYECYPEDDDLESGSYYAESVDESVVSFLHSDALGNVASIREGFVDADGFVIHANYFYSENKGAFALDEYMSSSRQRKCLKQMSDGDPAWEKNIVPIPEGWENLFGFSENSVAIQFFAGFDWDDSLPPRIGMSLNNIMQR